ncbi:DNA-directed RNA polymerase subunit L [Candidatus Woesearchaeota archaeon]|nr:MAG: DNA-directed RNA polymerase subunit L [Candidatus Woesearchaeota archaeon]
MEIHVKEDSKKRAVFSVRGADHTTCNILKVALQKEKGVTIATYSVKHPLVDDPLFIIETNGTVSPKQAIHKAVASIIAENKKTDAEFKKAS